jgi:hypothetical protein
MKKIFRYFILFCFIIASISHAVSQVKISGPTCVVAGTVYQYTITGKWDAATTMQVCLSSGTIANSGANTCTPTGTPLSAVLVVWNDSISTSGTVSVTSSAGNTTLKISFTKPLLPGAISDAEASKTINAGAIPSTINCSVAAGGACNNSNFSYQWQQSFDMVAWTDIPGANAKNLPFNIPLTQTVFFRRKVTETMSGTIGYSNIATINVLVNASSLNTLNKSITGAELVANFQSLFNCFHLKTNYL